MVKMKDRVREARENCGSISRCLVILPFLVAEEPEVADLRQTSMSEIKDAEQIFPTPYRSFLPLFSCDLFFKLSDTGLVGFR